MDYSLLRKELPLPPGPTQLIRKMLSPSAPLTLENYLAANYGERDWQESEPLGIEEVMEMPEVLQEVFRQANLPIADE